jgi:hypothetical protein
MPASPGAPPQDADPDFTEDDKALGTGAAA